MSRGLGRVQRAVLTALTVKNDWVLVQDLSTLSHVESVRRAVFLLERAGLVETGYYVTKISRHGGPRLGVRLSVGRHPDDGPSPTLTTGAGAA